MPTKKKEEVETTTTEATLDTVPTLCGHIDRHSLGTDNKPDNPACDLPAGHTGDHHGVHQMRVERERFYERETGKLLKVEYDIVDAEVWWTDAAGTPAKDIVPGPMPSRSKKAEILQMVEQLIQG